MHKQIYTRTPFYTQYTSTEDVVTLELRVWAGSESNKPVTPSYTLSRTASGEAFTFEIAELINDYIEHKPNIGSKGAVFVNVVMSDGVNPSSDETYIATEGYLLYTEGIQKDDTLNGNKFVGLPESGTNQYRVQVPEGGTLSTTIPVKIDPDEVGTWSYQKQGEASVNFDTSLDTIPTFFPEVSVTSDYSWVTFDLNGETHTVYVDVLRCSKFEPIKLTYVNKKGLKSDFWFHLRSSERLAIKEERYNRSLMNYTSLADRSTEHVNLRHIHATSQYFTVNSDFMSEYYVKQIEELFLSEYVWLTKVGQDPIPVNVMLNSIEKKTHLNDKLINYTFELETATQYVNTIR